jgi:hypothetical protein
VTPPAERAVTAGEARRLLDALAEQLVARGLPEDLSFAIDLEGRRPRRARASALWFIGFDDGVFSCWYRESAERHVVKRSEDFAEVRDCFVRAVEDEDRSYRSQFGEDA